MNRNVKITIVESGFVNLKRYKEIASIGEKEMDMAVAKEWLEGLDVEKLQKDMRGLGKLKVSVYKLSSEDNGDTD